MTAIGAVGVAVRHAEVRISHAISVRELIMAGYLGIEIESEWKDRPPPAWWSGSVDDYVSRLAAARRG